MMAFVGASPRAEAGRVLVSQRRVIADGRGDNAMFTRHVGRPLCLAIQDFAEDRHASAVEGLRPIRGIAQHASVAVTRNAI